MVRIMSFKSVLLVALLTLFVGGALAQSGPAITPDITDDQINEIASKMYCPVCENIPLDTCGTAACDDWRNEIRLYLADGWTEEQIVDDFIARFGERVVGTPKDPFLRTLALWTPWLLSALALLAAGYTLLRWQNGRHQPAERPAPATAASFPDDDYRSRFEHDLQAL